METAIKILHLEDNPNDALLLQSTLKSSNVNFEYFFADNEIDYRSHLGNEKIDIILSDYKLPNYNGMEALLYAKNNYPAIPFIFISGTMGEDAAIESMLNGATDYVLKNKLERLAPAVYRAIKEVQEKEARHIVEIELHKLSRAVEQSPVSVIITDTRGRIEYVNPTTIKLSGYSSKELIGNNPRILSSGEKTKEEYSALWENISSGHVWQGEFHNKMKNGELRWEAATISPIFDSEGTITHYLAIEEDITQRKKLTQDLITAKEKAEESDRLKTAFLNNISHEIRTPMNAIIGFSEFLNDPALRPEDRQQYTDLIVNNCDKLLSIITSMVNISTIETGQAKITENEINLNSKLKQIHEQFLPDAKKKSISLNIIPYLPYEDRIVSDETKLVQVLTNLIDNAIKFTKQGHVNFGYVVKANELDFFVEDTGIGIPIEMNEEIFKRFSQIESTVAREYGGSGLGLSISKAYIELLGGKIWFTSELDKGSTFHFTIPLKRAKKETGKERNSMAKKHSDVETKNGLTELKTLLIAEDEDSNFKLMEALILKLNVHIIRAMNGVEAIEACKSKHIDVVLMDLKMPVMDGYEAIKHIRELMPNLPIIAQTAYSTDRNLALACGCNDFISKPFKSNVLISKIKEQLYKR